MPILTRYFYKSSNSKKTEIYIETGTYLGTGLKEVKNHYKDIHSIEVSKKWYEYNLKQFEKFKKINLHLGDSKEVLKVLCKKYNAPITFFLDAHYSGKHTSMSDIESPLLEELEIIYQRNNKEDIVIIDDTRMIGNSGITGNKDKNSIYPETSYDWTYITFDKIKNIFGCEFDYLHNTKYNYTSGPSDQLIIVFKNPTKKAIFLLPSFVYEFRFRLKRKIKNLFASNSN